MNMLTPLTVPQKSDECDAIGSLCIQKFLFHTILPDELAVFLSFLPLGTL